ncbi:MAG: hypothetical protein STSR0004_08310 [Peptococcaceae bacterium]
MDISAEENTMPKIPFDSSISGYVALEDGDIVFTDASEDYDGVGKSVVIYNKEQRPAIAGLHTIVAKGKTSDLFRDYKRFCMQTKYIRKQFVFYATGVSVFGVTKNSIGKIITVLPPLPEQEKIAEILSTWDKAIELKEQLIAGKKQQKKWLMQNLLTGKKRLPGFSNEWQEIRLGDLGVLKSGSGFPEVYQNNTDYDIPFYKVSDLGDSNNKIWLSTANHYINDTIRETIKAIVLPANTIVFTKIGAALFLERKRLLRYDSCIDNNMMGFYVDEFKSEYLFVYYLLELKKISQFYNNGPVPSLSVGSIANISISIPSKSEQTAIANILSASDREIDLHEKQLDELKKQKKALMQLLLTGIVRVNLLEVS